MFLDEVTIWLPIYEYGAENKYFSFRSSVVATALATVSTLPDSNCPIIPEKSAFTHLTLYPASCATFSKASISYPTNFPSFS